MASVADGNNFFSQFCLMWLVERKSHTSPSNTLVITKVDLHFVSLLTLCVDAHLDLEIPAPPPSPPLDSFDNFEELPPLPPPIDYDITAPVDYLEKGRLIYDSFR